MSYMIVDVLGFTGVAGEKKGTLGDSSISEDGALGQYGSIAEAKAAKSEQIRAITSTQGYATEPIPVGGGGMYNPLNNRPMNR
jgi:hypothetical protein